MDCDKHIFIYMYLPRINDHEHRIITKSDMP
jgi:hypothetical protein